ncbi:MAG: phosphatase PAP2 family protein [Myxococcales bacterium]|nr:phosphatase PAP2 family protein [Myxococcales bacterium]
MIRARVTAALLLSPGFAWALEPPPREIQSTLPGGAVTDVSLLVGAAGMIAAGTLAIDPSRAGRAPLDGLGHRDRVASTALASDLVFGVGAAATVGAGFWLEQRRGRRGLGLLRTPLIFTEAAALSLGVVSMVKNLGGVCRPRAWSDALAQCAPASDDDLRAFPSGHTAPLAALAGASLALWRLPHRHDSAYALLFGSSLALAGANLILRVEAGAHSWVDTGVGFALGFGLGFATAALHVRVGSVSLGALPQGVALSGRF